VFHDLETPEGAVTKSDRETMEILAAYDLTATYESAAELCGCDPKTVARYVAVRDAGKNPFHPDRRPRLVDPYLEKIEELVERSGGKCRPICSPTTSAPSPSNMSPASRSATRSSWRRDAITGALSGPTLSEFRNTRTAHRGSRPPTEASLLRWPNTQGPS
jgi:hypothetical protein